jgi:fatty-acid desaturase
MAIPTDTFTSKSLPQYATRGRLRLGRVGGVVAIHLFALSAPFCFSWASLYLAIALAILTGQFGITLGFHRLLVHRSYDTPTPIRYLLAFLGCLALQTGPISWSAIHRYHHQHSDAPDDPHTPRPSFLWSHIFWFFFLHPELSNYARKKRFAQDLDRDAGMRFLEAFHYPINILFALAIFSVGVAAGGWSLGLSLFVWGVCVRVVYIWHVTFLVNSASHLWGYRRYATPDNSRNNWWVALVAFGEGWHNNHHADPHSAKHGRRWFEIDTTYGIIRCMEMIGLVRNVVRPRDRAPTRPCES